MFDLFGKNTFSNELRFFYITVNVILGAYFSFLSYELQHSKPESDEDDYIVLPVYQREKR